MAAGLGMMDIRWLEDLLALAETRSFRKAAELAPPPGVPMAAMRGMARERE
jgi:hypothetical protein